MHEENIEQLEGEITNNKGLDTIIFPKGYLSNESTLKKACELAKEFNVNIITTYRHDNKDRAAIINKLGCLVFERAKTPPDEKI